jgi:DNA replication protein DnaC
MTPKPELSAVQELKQQASNLKLNGILAHWDELSEAQLPMLQTLLQWELVERKQRGLERRLGHAHLGSFKSLADFDWDWPAQCDRGAISDLLQLDFIKDATNIILMGPNGTGKSTIAQNIAYQAVLQGYGAVFVEASQMLADLSAKDGDNALRRRIKYYAQPPLLVIDEVGYLSYGSRHADLLFEIINRRYELKSTIVTTNKPFSEWGEVFPNAACVVSMLILCGS